MPKKTYWGSLDNKLVALISQCSEDAQRYMCALIGFSFASQENKADSDELIAGALGFDSADRVAECRVEINAKFTEMNANVEMIMKARGKGED